MTNLISLTGCDACSTLSRETGGCPLGLPHTSTEAISLHHDTPLSPDISRMSPVLEAVWHANRICRGNYSQSVKYRDVISKLPHILDASLSVDDLGLHVVRLAIVPGWRCSKNSLSYPLTCLFWCHSGSRPLSRSSGDTRPHPAISRRYQCCFSFYVRA
jgi:hypothetical protein